MQCQQKAIPITSKTSTVASALAPPLTASTRYDQLKKTAEKLMVQHNVAKTEARLKEGKLAEAQQKIEKLESQLKLLAAEKSRLEQLSRTEQGRLSQVEFDIVSTKGLCEKLRAFIASLETKVGEGLRSRARPHKHTSHCAAEKREAELAAQIGRQSEGVSQLSDNLAKADAEKLRALKENELGLLGTNVYAY